MTIYIFLATLYHILRRRSHGLRLWCVRGCVWYFALPASDPVLCLLSMAYFCQSWKTGLGSDRPDLQYPGRTRDRWPTLVVAAVDVRSGRQCGHWHHCSVGPCQGVRQEFRFWRRLDLPCVHLHSNSGVRRCPIPWPDRGASGWLSTPYNR